MKLFETQNGLSSNDLFVIGAGFRRVYEEGCRVGVVSRFVLAVCCNASKGYNSCCWSERQSAIRRATGALIIVCVLRNSLFTLRNTGHGFD